MGNFLELDRSLVGTLMNRSFPARMGSPLLWTVFSLLFFLFAIGGLARLNTDHRTGVRLEADLRILATDLFEIESLQTALRSMDEARTSMGKNDSQGLAEYHGWRLQGASVLSDLSGHGDRLTAGEKGMLKGVSTLFSYLERQEDFVRKGSLSPEALLPLGVNTQIYSLLTRLTRRIHAHQTLFFLKREALSRDRQVWVFLLVLFLLTGLLSFGFSSFLSSRTRRAIRFQMGLLDQFVLTGSVIKDWRGHLRRLLSGLSAAGGIRCLFAFFPGEGDGPLCELFWAVPPSEGERLRAESLIRESIGGSEGLAGYGEIPIRHEYLRGEGHLSGATGERLEMLARTLSLPDPPVIGMAGIGVEGSRLHDPVRRQVFEGILSSLLNLLGSVRAISSYTEKLEYYAARDPLTNLYNQRIFWDLLNYEVGRSERHSQRFVLMVIDLDDFKRINDSFGHKAGDLCLVRVSELFRQSVRREDILFRYGGDEFCIILPETGIEQGWSTANRILEGVSGMSVPVEGGVGIPLFVSIGIAAWPRHGRDGRELFLMADNMMYKAKRAGKNQCALPADSDLAATFRHEGDIYLMLRKAVIEERFIPYYQPIRDVASGGIFAHEVLVRLPRADRPAEMMPAFEFIEVMERTGLVGAMDALVRKKAFEAHALANSSFPLFLNLSPGSFLRREGLEELRSLVRNAGIDPSMIVFEITEREAVENLEELVQFMKEMRSIGVRFAIDDFGSGFASFDYLRELPVSFVKIGGEIVLNLALHDHVDRLIVESLVKISRRQGIYVIAETIETEVVMAEVRRLGVSLVQGYFIGPPASSLLA